MQIVRELLTGEISAGNPQQFFEPDPYLYFSNLRTFCKNEKKLSQKHETDNATTGLQSDFYSAPYPLRGVTVV